MPTSYPELFRGLCRPFDKQQEKSRPGQKGTTLIYVTKEVLQNRLDEEIGPENWRCSYEKTGDGAFRCRLELRVDGEWIAKEDGGAAAGMQAQDDDEKSAYTDAFKRACHTWGIGRYLAKVPPPRFDGFVPDNAPPRRAPEQREPSKAEKLFDWCKAKGLLPEAETYAQSQFRKGLTILSDIEAQATLDWLRSNRPAEQPRPAAPPPPPRQEPPAAPRNDGAPRTDFRWPKSGGELAAWIGNLEGHYRIALKSLVFDLVEQLGWASKWREWTPRQVDQAARIVARKVQMQPGYDGQFDKQCPTADQARMDLADAMARFLRQLGNADPSWAEISQAVRAHSEGLPAEAAGGLVLTDLEKCDDPELMLAVLESVKRDLQESGAY